MVLRRVREEAQTRKGRQAVTFRVTFHNPERVLMVNAKDEQEAFRAACDLEPFFAGARHDRKFAEAFVAATSIDEKEKK